jgi:hypothetical protein
MANKPKKVHLKKCKTNFHRPVGKMDVITPPEISLAKAGYISV